MSQAPIWLVVNSCRPACAQCERALPPKFRAVEVEETYDAEDGEARRRLLLLCCDEQCQQLVAEDLRLDGYDEPVLWPGERVREALNDPDNFDAVVDVSLENFERVLARLCPVKGVETRIANS